MASPNHHISHAAANPDHGVFPAKNRLPAPAVAAIIVGTKAPNETSASTSRRPGSSARNRTRRKKKAPVTMLRLLPVAIPSEVKAGMPVK